MGLTLQARSKLQETQRSPTNFFFRTETSELPHPHARPHPFLSMAYPLTTTLNRIYACSPCADGWKQGLAAAGKLQGDDEPITYAAIIDAVGPENAFWCCRAEPQYANIWRRYAVWCARQAQHLMTDARSVAALDVAERHANGLATDDELAAARAAAWDAARAAAGAAAWAAAGAAARAAAWAAAGDAAGAAAGAAARAAAGAAAGAAAWAAAWDAARDAQATAFRQLVTTGTLT